MSQFPEAPTDHQDRLDHINSLSHEDMARLWRFAPSGHPYFPAPESDDDKLAYFALLKKRFDLAGGMTPEISKKIGWGES